MVTLSSERLKLLSDPKVKQALEELLLKGADGPPQVKVEVGTDGRSENREQRTITMTRRVA